MRIVELETYRMAGQSNLVVVAIHGADDSVGLGDTFYGASAVEHYLHEVAAPVLLGSDDVNPQRVALDLSPYVGYQGSGAEMRANSAVDVALWDLLGRVTGQPVSALLGGAVRSDVPVYNTCAGSYYVGTTGRQHSSNWGIDGGGHQFEDLRAFLTEPGRLAQDLLDEGIGGMKIWPFDQAAEETNGCHISRRSLDEGCRLVAEIRDTVGDQIDVMIELHGLWNLPSAVAIVKALEPYEIRWVEDPIRPDAAGALVRLKNETAVPIAVGETVAGSRGYLPLLTGGGLDIAIVDAVWTGGITAARKVASLVDSFGLPITPHDATGPMGLMAGIHLNLSQPNGFVQEIVRAFYHGWYQDLVVGLPEIANGRIAASDGPGFGVELTRGLAERPDVSVRSTTLSDLG
ncbi:MAG: mandelate racemase/muconate lactonizing enzyme family protein [Acidimicrobiia bacterium]|nr:MAG: mandelate racemase/muconate lactonizing enzyme family protein [Acidimicrobiia bacterium]